MLAMLASIGLVRYAYSPLVPSMIGHDWISNAQVGYLGTVNFIGNVLGAVLCGWLSRRFSGGVVIRAALVLGLASVGLSALDWGPWWLGGCRFFAGFTAAGGMILAPALATQGVPAAHRGRIIGTVFAGAGLGVVLLSLTLPGIMGDRPEVGWLYAAGLTLVCLIIAWTGLKTRASARAGPVAAEASNPNRGRLVLLATAYLFAAAAIVPHSIYLAAYLHVVMDQPLSFSMSVYAVYGAGVLIGGPLLDGPLQRLIGRRAALTLAMVLGLIAALMVTLTQSVWIAVASGAVLGVSQMGYASLTTHRVLALAGPSGHIRWWGRLTVVFNTSMAGGAFAMGYLISIGSTVAWGYLAGFWMAAGCFAISAVLNAMVTTPPGVDGRT